MIPPTRLPSAWKFGSEFAIVVPFALVMPYRVVGSRLRELSAEFIVVFDMSRTQADHVVLHIFGRIVLRQRRPERALVSKRKLWVGTLIVDRRSGISVRHASSSSRSA